MFAFGLDLGMGSLAGKTDCKTGYERRAVRNVNEPAPPYKTPTRTWWLCGFLFMATVLNYLDRQVLALTAERIIGEFHISQEGFGEIIAAFRYAYAIFQIGGGWMVDLWGPRTVYPVAVGIWSLAGILTGLSVSVRSLAGFRFMLGSGEAFNWPSALKITKRLIPPKDRALANGIFNSGAAAGAMVAPVIVTLVTLYFGWRAAFVVTGLLGAIWLIGWLRFSRPVSHQLGGSPRSALDILRVMRRILLLRGFWLLAVSAIIINSVNYFLADWIPLYLKTERGFSFSVGNALSIVVYASLEAGNILVGLFIKRLAERGFGIAAARKFALFGSCLMMSSAAFVGVTPYRYLAVALLMLTACGVASFLVIYLTLVQDLDPVNVGASAGLLGGLGNLAYGYASPYIGRLADLNESALTFAAIGLLPWFAFAAIFWGVDLEER